MRPTLSDIYRLTGFLLYPPARLLAPLFGFFQRDLSTAPAASAPGRVVYRYGERLGLYEVGSLPDVAGTVWVHAASVGEVQAALILLAALAEKYERHRFVLTCTTKQGHELARARLPQEVACIMAPLDMPQAVDRAIRAIRPGLYICLETELWPLLLHRLRGRGVPMLLLNARLSERSFSRYRRLGRIMAEILGGFARIAPISADDAGRFEALGASAERLRGCGNVKFDLPFDADGAAAVRAAHREALGLAPEERLLVCGSTHGGEEAALLEAFAAMPEIQKILLAPRHLERLHEVEALLQAKNLAFVRWSALKAGGAVQGSERVVLLDTIGELADLYAAGDFCFCGGSLVPGVGGHNVMEAARWGRPVYFGPHMKEWRGAADLLVASGGGFMAPDAAALAVLIRAHLADSAGYESACAAARNTAAAQRGALARQMEIVSEFL